MLYKILVELFPNYLVSPNVALQNIFHYERMQELLTSEQFEYFLKTHVDFCITKIADYYPLVAFELDSDYHDQEEMRKKDEDKNQIFYLGGIVLLRVRPFEQLTEEFLRQEVINLIQEWRQGISSVCS